MQSVYELFEYMVLPSLWCVFHARSSLNLMVQCRTLLRGWIQDFVHAKQVFYCWVLLPALEFYRTLLKNQHKCSLSLSPFLSPSWKQVYFILFYIYLFIICVRACPEVKRQLAGVSFLLPPRRSHRTPSDRGCRVWTSHLCRQASFFVGWEVPWWYLKSSGWW